MISIVVSIVTIFSIWLIGRKDWRGWAVGLGNQALWLVLIAQTHAWGLLLLTGTLIFLYTKALIVWRREAERSCPDCGADGSRYSKTGWCSVCHYGEEPA